MHGLHAVAHSMVGCGVYDPQYHAQLGAKPVDRSPTGPRPTTHLERVVVLVELHKRPAERAGLAVLVEALRIAHQLHLCVGGRIQNRERTREHC